MPRRTCVKGLSAATSVVSTDVPYETLPPPLPLAAAGARGATSSDHVQRNSYKRYRNFRQRRAAPFLSVLARNPPGRPGVALPAGAEVLVGYASANRDTSLTDRPDVFDITRAPTRHLAFAAGVHAWVGAGLARRELAVTLRTLTRRLPGLRLAPGREPMVRRSLAARGPVTLHATW